MTASLLRLALVLFLVGGLLGQPPQTVAQAGGLPQTVHAAPSPLRIISKPTPAWPVEPLVPLAYCSTPNLAIPDNGTVSDVITLTNPGVIGDMNVTDFSILQNGVGDLVITLVHEKSGLGTLLLNRPKTSSGGNCDNGVNIPNIIFNDDGTGIPTAQNSCVNTTPAYITNATYTPAYPLRAFDGLPIASTYRLIIQDTGGGGGTGTLQKWCLLPTSAPAAPDPGLILSRNSLLYSQMPNTVITRALVLTNTGILTTTLDWAVTEGATITLLYDNGPLVTSPRTGFAGDDESVVQKAGLGITNLVFDIQESAKRRAADDFVVPAAGWQVDHLVFWGLEVNSGNTPTISAGFVELWDGKPDAGGSVIAGDLTTDRLQEVSFANLYRRFDTEPAGTVITRPVMRAVLSAPVTLVAGTYWAEISANGDSGLAGPYAPFTTKPDAVVTGNALKRDNNTWSPFLANGTNTPQGLPFQIYGYRKDVPGCTHPQDVDWLTAITPITGSTPGGSTVILALQSDTTGKTAGTYTTTLCITSNDPAQSLIAFPVTLVVPANFTPTLSVAPASVAVSAPVSSTTSHNLSLSNIGSTGSNLSWGVFEAIGSGPEGAGSSFAMPNVTQGPLFSLAEGFTNVANLPAYGWVMLNRSAPVGITGWGQGRPAIFSAHFGTADAYVYANYNNTAGAGNISNWLLTPELELRNGASLVFYTRVPTTTNFADRLQVRLSTNGASTNVGSSATSVGDFGHLLLDINPTLVLTGYPNSWTGYTLVLTNITVPTTGRIAFRYFVENGGPNGAHSNYIGIDSVRYNQPPANCTQFSAMPWLSLSPEPAQGTISAGNTNTLTLTFNTNGLTAGEDYTGKLCLISNDPARWLTTIPVTLTVAPTHQFTTTPDNYTSYGQVGQTYYFQVRVTNTGNAYDYYNVTLLNNPIYPTTAPTTVGPIGVGQEGTFWVQVQVPLTPSNPSSLATIEVKSVGNPNLVVNFDLRLFARTDFMYLPFIVKN